MTTPDDLDLTTRLRTPFVCDTIDGVDVRRHPSEDIEDLLGEAADAIERLGGEHGQAPAAAGSEASVSAERLAFIEALVTGGSLLERWERHTGVSTVDDLRRWGESQLRETLMLRARRATDEGPAKDELEDYLIGKQAVLMPLLANLRQIAERSGSGG